MNSEVRSSPTGRVSHVPNCDITMLDLRAWVSLTLFKVSSKNPNQCKRPIPAFVFSVGRITKNKKLCYLCKRKRFHRNRYIFYKVRTNLYTTHKLATIIVI